MSDHTCRTGPAVEAHFQLLNWLMQTVERFPKSQKFLLGDRIQKTALDVLEYLIEATYTRDRRAHLARANLGLEKLRFFFRFAFEQRHLDLTRELSDHSYAYGGTGASCRRVLSPKRSISSSMQLRR
ncbi:MAG: diversity-generating retroelement protein Avd [Hyphomicrobiaceae bacterium]